MIYALSILNLLLFLLVQPAYGKSYVNGSWADDAAYRYNGTSWDAAKKYHYDSTVWNEIEAVAAPNTCSGQYGEAPTFVTNATMSSRLDGRMHAWKVAINCSGTTASVDVRDIYINDISKQIYVAIYTDTGSGPGTLLGSAGPYYNANASEWPAPTSTINISTAISGDPQFVWVAIQHQDAASGLRVDTGTTGTYYYSTATAFGTIPDTWTTVGTETGDAHVQINF